VAAAPSLSGLAFGQGMLVNLFNAVGAILLAMVAPSWSAEFGTLVFAAVQSTYDLVMKVKEASNGGCSGSDAANNVYDATKYG
jgi:hypothetical protein